MKKVLFACVHNSGRSQMAEAFFNQKAQAKAVATSAGTNPATQVNPTVVSTMREVGLDIAENKPKMLTAGMLEGAARVITMGCNVAEACPATFTPTEDWDLDDPEGKPIEEVRRIRDDIRARVDELVRTIP
jgi:protein-tyrosine-phosphatase